MINPSNLRKLITRLLHCLTCPPFTAKWIPSLSGHDCLSPSVPDLYIDVVCSSNINVRGCVKRMYSRHVWSINFSHTRIILALGTLACYFFGFFLVISLILLGFLTDFFSLKIGSQRSFH